MCSLRRSKTARRMRKWGEDGNAFYHRFSSHFSQLKYAAPRENRPLKGGERRALRRQRAGEFPCPERGQKPLPTGGLRKTGACGSASVILFLMADAPLPPEGKWDQVRDLFHEALELSPDAWEAFLAQIADRALAAEVRSLLAAHEQS